MQARTNTLDGVIEVIVDVLGIEDRADQITADTPLFGSLPELDSLAVVQLLAALEERFDIEVMDDDITGEVFDTVGSLTDFVEERRTSTTPHAMD